MKVVTVRIKSYHIQTSLRVKHAIQYMIGITVKFSQQGLTVVIPIQTWQVISQIMGENVCTYTAQYNNQWYI